MSDDVSASEAARRIGTSTRTVQRWIATGRLAGRRVGGRWRVANDAIVAFDAHEESEQTNTLPIRTLFVANRGEIAARIRRTADRLGIATVIPRTEGPDAVDLLSIEAVVTAAAARRRRAASRLRVPRRERRLRRGGHRRRHPLGRAAANDDPGMGDKAAARRLSAELGVPVVPGYDGADQDDATLVREANAIGLPLLIKPAAGGGGKGMRSSGRRPHSRGASRPLGARRWPRSATTGSSSSG
jgi:excisionase family DNA binding protein